MQKEALGAESGRGGIKKVGKVNRLQVEKQEQEG